VVKRFWLYLVAVVALAGGCSSSETTPTTTSAAPGADSTTTSAEVTTSTPPPTTTTTTTAAVTTTTLASRPEALQLVSDIWDWQQLLQAEIPHEIRYDGTYLVYTYEWEQPLVVVRDGTVVLEHESPDDSEWIIQDTELGSHWLAVVENTEGAGPDAAHVVVYDLFNGETVFEEFYRESEGRLSIPAISVSGRYLAIAPQLESANCFDVYDLVAGFRYEEICADSSIFYVELDAAAFAFDTYTPDCRAAWTGTLYGQDHNLATHANRECWSSSPASSGEFSAWFEHPPQTIGIDTMIGLDTAGNMVGLSKGDNGTLEVCWNRAYWLSGDNDVRTWDGGGEVRTIYEAGDDRAYELGCVGPWVTFRTMDAIYTANMFTQSDAAACDVVEIADAPMEAELAETLTTWVHGRFDDLPEDLEVSVSDGVGRDGWWVARGGFSDRLEGAVFAWNPDGDISLAWSGTADSEYEIREHMLSILPEAPGAILGCVDVSGYH
jgi:hypothetical protein